MHIIFALALKFSTLSEMSTSFLCQVLSPALLPRAWRNTVKNLSGKAASPLK